MPLRRIIPRVAVLAALLLWPGNAAFADTLRVGGSGAFTAMFPHLFSAFDRGEAHKLELVPGLGVNGGVRALNEGVLDMAFAGRSLKPEELALGMTQSVTIQTPFVLVTSHPHPNGLKSSEVASFYSSAKATWADGSLIRIILRPKSDGDTPTLQNLFPEMTAALEQARRRTDLSHAATDQDNADLAERLPGSLTASTLTQIKIERRNLRLIALNGVEPLLENLENGTYPFPKVLYFVLPTKKLPIAERFVKFLQSPEGQAALRATGNVLIAN